MRLSSTLQCRKQSPKADPFENALQSGAIWKRCFMKTLFSSVDGENDAIWKRWRDQYRQDRGVRPLNCDYPKWRTDAPMWLQFRAISRADILRSACVEFIWAYALKVWKRFQNEYDVVVWTGENDMETLSVDANLVENGAKKLRFRLKTV